MSVQTFLLPDLGEGLTEAEIVRWLVAEGDEVQIDQPVVEVETAKSVVEVPSPFGGRVASLHGREGETLDVGKPLISVEARGDGPAGAVGPPTPAQPAVANPSAAETHREEEQAGSGNVLIGYGTSGSAGPGRRRRPRSQAGRTLTRPATPPGSSIVEPAGAMDTVGPALLVVSPLVRRLARERGVDLGSITGAGVGGVITRADVEGAAPPSRDTPVRIAAAGSPVAGSVRLPGERRTRLSGFRKAASAALSRSRSEIPEATVWVDVDATTLVEFRESARTRDDPGPGLLAYLARFVVAALKEYPVLNSRLDIERQEIVELTQVNLGIAVQGDRGLVVPAIMGAESMSTTRLNEEIDRVAVNAREGRVTPGELSAGTFTLNNYGSFGVDGSAAIINHPQVAILGFGRILDRAWVVNGEIRIRKITQMSLVFDHRICDGGTAAGFMRSVADAIENPARAFARF